MTRLELAIGAALVTTVGAFGLGLLAFGDDEVRERPPEVAKASRSEARIHARPDQGWIERARERDEEAAVPEAMPEDREVAARPEPPEAIRQSIAAARHFARHLADEADDPAWAHDAETMLRDKLGDGTFPGLTLVGLDCRSTLCRIDVEATDPTIVAQMFERLPLELSWPGDAMIGPDPDQRTTTVMYLSRQGMPLPMPS